MTATLEQARQIALQLPPEELRTLFLEIRAVVTETIAPETAAPSKWERIIRRVEAAHVGPESRAAADQFRQDVRDIHDNVLDC
jgi:hypothetical protein